MATAPIADSWGFHVRKSDLLYGLATVQSIQAIQSVQTIQSVKGWRVGGCPIPSYGLKKMLKYIGVLYLSFWRLENRIKQVTDTTKHTTNIVVSDLQSLDSSWNLIRRLANKSQGSGLNTENIQHVAGVVVISDKVQASFLRTETLPWPPIGCWKGSKIAVSKCFQVLSWCHMMS